MATIQTHLKKVDALILESEQLGYAFRNVNLLHTYKNAIRMATENHTCGDHLQLINHATHRTWICKVCNREYDNETLK